VPRRSRGSLQGIRYAALLALLTALAGGAAFAYVEKDPSTWDGVWWAVTTMTTVGYGDVSPTTTSGRLIGIVVMLVGIGFIALMTGAVAERFLAREVAEIEEDVAEEAETVDAVLAELRAVKEQLEGLEARIQRSVVKGCDRNGVHARHSASRLSIEPRAWASRAG
jgi:voltage-gated potassium channel